MTPGMTLPKRAFDLTLVTLGGALLALPFAGLLVWLALTEGRPLFYGAERMRAPGHPFTLWKLRTMTPAPPDGGVSGGDKAARVTAAGRWLRRYRLDEIPQLWNILRGEMSLVGPRPPLRRYVERFPDLYAAVLRVPPGITGLATLTLHGWEERLLAASRTAAETDAVYARRSVPRKARLDLIYARHASVCFDALILWRTLLRVLRRRRPAPEAE
jgi:lipopolysaccharide/colanic/teichoic acid biosynthesis glycosyltransferase